VGYNLVADSTGLSQFV